MFADYTKIPQNYKMERHVKHYLETLKFLGTEVCKDYLGL